MAPELRLALVVPEHLNPAGVQIRTAGTNDSPLFCLVDVCQVLDLALPHRVADRLDDDEKVRHIVTTPGGPQEALFVTEPGLMRVLVTTRLKDDTGDPAITARNERIHLFRRWVFHEVLPCIRKHGCYPAPTAIVPVASPAREPMEVVRGFLETCTNILGLGGMDDRNRIILKDFARNRLLLDANCSAPNRRFHSIVDRAMTIGYPRLRSPHDSLCGRYVATAYRNKKNEEPTKHEQTVRGRTTMVNTYEDKDLDIIDQGIHAFFLDHPDLA